MKPISFLTLNTLINVYSQQTMASVNKIVQLSPLEMIFSGKLLWCREILLLIPYPTFRQILLADASFCTMNPLFIKHFSKGVPWEEKAMGSGQHFMCLLYPCNSSSSLPHLQVSSTTSIPNFPMSVHTSLSWASHSLFSHLIRAVHVPTGRHTRYMGWLASLAWKVPES